MADEEHLDLIRSDVGAWNDWREGYPHILPNLRKAKLAGLDLSGANFNDTNLRRSDLRGANLTGATFRRTDMRRAKMDRATLHGVDFTSTNLIDTSLREASLRDSYIYGVSAWNIDLEGAEQRGLIISRRTAPLITVDDLRMAQFIYLLVNDQGLQSMINTMGRRSVLILGRFTPQVRKDVLDGIRDKLRALNYIPVIFDFDRPDDRDYTETIGVLARLSLFVIVDITNPRSSPLELQSTVPDVKVPFVPIISKEEQPFAMFRDLTVYPWMMKLRRYADKEQLLANLERKIIQPALKKHNELTAAKAQDMQIEDMGD